MSAPDLTTELRHLREAMERYDAGELNSTALVHPARTVLHRAFPKPERDELVDAIAAAMEDAENESDEPCDLAELARIAVDVMRAQR